jgi:hypothetical protein
MKIDADGRAQQKQVDRIPPSVEKQRCHHQPGHGRFESPAVAQPEKHQQADGQESEQENMGIKQHLVWPLISPRKNKGQDRKLPHSRAGWWRFAGLCGVR